MKEKIEKMIAKAEKLHRSAAAAAASEKPGTQDAMLAAIKAMAAYERIQTLKDVLAEIDD